MKKILPPPPSAPNFDVDNVLNDPNVLRAMLGIIIFKTYGVWSFTQEDFDMIAGKKLTEGMDLLGRYCLAVTEKPAIIQ